MIHCLGMKTDSQKLDELIKVVSHLAGRFSHIEGQFSHLEGRFTHFEGRFSRLEEGQDVLTVRLGAVEDYIHEELSTKKEVASFRGEVLDQLDSHTHMLVRLDEERLITHERLIRLEEKVK